MSDDYAATLGRNVRALREERHLTQVQLTSRMRDAGFRISQSTISKIESGSRTLLMTEAAALRQILAASWDELAGQSHAEPDDAWTEGYRAGLRAASNLCIAALVRLDGAS